MIQFIVKWLLFSVGTLYTLIERFRDYPNEEKDNILGIPVEEDLQEMNRFELCGFMDKHLPRPGFWDLNSTTKIRLGVQLFKNAISNIKDVSETIVITKK